MNGGSSIHAGVTQGTKVGPILFLIMSNDTRSHSALPYYEYVDDLTIVESRKHSQQTTMQSEIMYMVTTN